MLRTLKFSTKDQDIWFTSDLHLNHNPKWPIPLWKSRGYETLDAHNEDIFTKINENVQENDILFHAGDLTLNTTEEQFEEFLGRFKCKNIYTLFGNHPNPMAKIYKREVEKFFIEHIYDDSVNHSVFQGKPEIYPFRYKNLVFIGDYAEIIVDGQFICLSHYPLSIWNHMSSGSWALVGHSHLGFEKTLPANKENKILDLGWDGYKKPLSFTEIKSIMDTKQYKKVDTHH